MFDVPDPLVVHVLYLTLWHMILCYYFLPP